MDARGRNCLALLLTKWEGERDKERRERGERGCGSGRVRERGGGGREQTLLIALWLAKSKGGRALTAKRSLKEIILEKNGKGK